MQVIQKESRQSGRSSSQSLLADFLTDGTQIEAKRFLCSELEVLPDHAKLSIVTDILTQSLPTNERLQELIVAAWNYACERGLWSLEYESIAHFRKLVSYHENIRPVIAQYNKTMKSKGVSLQRIEDNWGISINLCFPAVMNPPFWSKHLLATLAVLSKHLDLAVSINLLQEEAMERPRRSRNSSHLLASDVERVIDRLGIHPKRIVTSSTDDGGT